MQTTMQVEMQVITQTITIQTKMQTTTQVEMQATTQAKTHLVKTLTIQIANTKKYGKDCTLRAIFFVLLTVSFLPRNIKNMGAGG